MKCKNFKWCLKSAPKFVCPWYKVSPLQWIHNNLYLQKKCICVFVILCRLKSVTPGNKAAISHAFRPPLYKIFIFFIYVKYFGTMELSNVKDPKYICHIHSFLTSIHYVNWKPQTLGIIMISYYFVYWIVFIVVLSIPRFFCFNPNVITLGMQNVMSPHLWNQSLNNGENIFML